MPALMLKNIFFLQANRTPIYLFTNNLLKASSLSKISRNN